MGEGAWGYVSKYTDFTVVKAVLRILIQKAKNQKKTANNSLALKHKSQRT